MLLLRFLAFAAFLAAAAAVAVAAAAAAVAVAAAAAAASCLCFLLLHPSDHLTQLQSAFTSFG